MPSKIGPKGLNNLLGESNIELQRENTTLEGKLFFGDLRDKRGRFIPPLLCDRAMCECIDEDLPSRNEVYYLVTDNLDIVRCRCLPTRKMSQMGGVKVHIDDYDLWHMPLKTGDVIIIWNYKMRRRLCYEVKLK